MFEHPLPIPRETTYDQLGLGPEATSQEITEAIQELAAHYRRQKAEVQRQLGEVHGRVKDLKQAAADVQHLKAAGEESDPKELIRAESNLGKLEEQALAVNPVYRELCDRLEELEKQIVKTNQISLQNPDERLRYDQLNAPLDLLKLSDRPRDPFADRRNLLVQVRQELSCFLAAAGEPVFHPSDLTREDFTSDFHYHEFLDG